MATALPQRVSVMIRRTPLRRVSKKRARELKAYSLLRAAFLKARPYCEVCEVIGLQPRLAREIHHMARRGPNLLNTETWLPVCREAHEWIHNNPGKARKLG